MVPTFLLEGGNRRTTPERASQSGSPQMSTELETFAASIFPADADSASPNWAHYVHNQLIEMCVFD